MHDAVFIFAKALRKADDELALRPVSLDCSVKRPWMQGKDVYRHLLHV